MDTGSLYTAFSGFSHLATGDLRSVLTRVREYLDREERAPLLIFDDQTGKQVDFDLHGSLEEVLDRAAPPQPKKGPGRPRLGVVCSEVCLLPKHWQWLERQSLSASGTLRRLVEYARRNESQEDRLRQKVEAAGRFMWSIAGNLQGFEEASRALYAGKWGVFDAQTASWPEDIKKHLDSMLHLVRSDARDAAGSRRALRYSILADPSPETTQARSHKRPWQLGAVALAASIARGELSAVDAVESYLERIRTVNPRVNGVTQVFEDEARTAAAEVDRSRARGEEVGPLAGVPFTVKENIDIAGHPTTHGIPAMKDAIPPVDAPIVQRLRDAGAIPIGHTNMPDLALRFHTSSQLFGATVNPWNSSLTPGGSSGGEGVALATGMSALGLGNDAGGSVRVPALFGAVAALKPSFGRFPSDRSAGPRNMSLASQVIPVDGIIARSVVDLHLTFQILAGIHSRDPRVVPAPLFGPALNKPIRVAVVADPGTLGVHPEVRRAVERAARILEKMGYETEPADLPNMGEITEAYGKMIMTEFHQSLPLLRRLLGEDGRLYVEFAMELQQPVDLPGYLNLTAAMQGLRREWAQFLDRFPLVLGPVFTEAIVPVDFDIRGIDEHRFVSNALRLCSATSFIGVPAVSVPTGITDGKPQGVQIISRPYREDLCLEAAAVIEAEAGRFTPIDPQGTIGHV